MSSNKLCGVCDECYNNTNRKPLMLPCGHSNCKQCIAQIEDTGSKLCSYCRTEWTFKDSSELPVCYQLLPEEINSNDEDNNIDGPPSSTHVCISMCLDHNFNNIFWCTDCNEEACKMCLIVKHKGCNFGLLEDCVRPVYVQFNKAFLNIKVSISQRHETILSCIDSNRQRIRGLQKFTKTLDKHEKNLLNYQDGLTVQESEIRDNLKILDAKLDDDGNIQDMDDNAEGGKLKALLEEKAVICRMNKPLPQLDDSKSRTLHRIVTTYQELESNPTEVQFITAFSQSYSSSHPSDPIIVDDDASASGALLQLFSCSLETPPNCIVVAHVTAVPQLTRLKFFLPIIAKHCGQELRIRLLDSFWGTANTDSSVTAAAIQSDSERLDDFLTSEQKNKLTEIFGCLDQKIIGQLKNLKLDTIGMTVNIASDVTLINNMHGNITVKNLHVSIKGEVIASNLSPLAVCTNATYSNISCFLHFPMLADGRLPWMMKIVSQLVPIVSTSERLSALCLPDCTISTGGAEMLLGLVHGCQLTTNVFLDDQKNAIDGDSRKSLQERYQRIGIKLEFNIDNVWKIPHKV